VKTCQTSNRCKPISRNVFRRSSMFTKCCIQWFDSLLNAKMTTIRLIRHIKEITPVRLVTWKTSLNVTFTQAWRLRRLQLLCTCCYGDGE